MEFKIDKRYVAIQSLKAIVGYLIGLFIVLVFLNIKDPWGFFASSFAAFVLLYFLIIYPKAIVVKDGYISFVKEYDYTRRKIKLRDIINIEKSFKSYNTVTLTTKSNLKYKLHPQNTQELVMMLEKHCKH